MDQCDDEREQHEGEDREGKVDADFEREVRDAVVERDVGECHSEDDAEDRRDVEEWEPEVASSD